MHIESEIITQNLDLLDIMENHPNDYQAIFQSSSQEENLGQFDLLFATEGFFPASSYTLQEIDISQQHYLAQHPDLLQSTRDKEIPFIGGYLIFISYEFNQSIHPKLFIHSHPANLSNGYHQVYLAKVEQALIFNHFTKKLHYLTKSAKQIYSLKKQVRDALTNRNKSPTPKIKVMKNYDQSLMDEAYQKAVKRAKKHIFRGDIYQANLSTPYHFNLLEKTHPIEIFRSLKKNNPAPFSALVNIDNFSIISSSPERLLQLKNGKLSTRPIAGTIGRSSDPLEDKNKIKELDLSFKDKAEHVMLVDLERNDLSTIALDHSLQVSERFIETYAFVHHLVSEIRVKLASNVNLLKIIHAVFPGGSITGCPKIRCMEIIRDIEQTPRFVYTGSVGYISEDGEIDLNILIRTLVLENNELSFRVGGGIVANSLPDLELIETKNKAIGLLRALEVQSK